MSIFRKAKDKLEQAQASRREASAQRQAYTSAVMQLAEPNADIPAILAALPGDAALNEKDREKLHGTAFLSIANAMLEDDVLDQTEEKNLLAAGNTLGVTQERLHQEFPNLLERLVIARVNDGRLPVIDAADVRLPLKSGEVVHLTTGAALTKWQAVKEWHGGSHGFSFRITKGVYYRTGQTRGRIVTTGQQLATEDTGILTVTSRRAVFSGAKRALEFDYRRLLDVEVFTDGIKLAVSNRQNPSVLHTDASGDVVAAVLNAAAGNAT